MYSALSRIYSAARRRLGLLIASLPGGHDGGRRRRRGRGDDRSSATSTPVSTPMSMYSVIAAGDDHPTPASSVAAEAADGSAAAGGGAAVQPAALPPLLPPPQMVVLALDATRDHREEEIRMALRAVVTRGDILRAGGDSLLVLGVLHAITNPSEGHAPPSFPTVGYQTKACIDSFAGTNLRLLSDQVKAKAEFYQNKLHHDVEELSKVGINVTLKVSPGSPAKFVIINEVKSSKAAWVVLDRHFRRDFKYLEKHIACKVAVFQDNLVVQPLKIIRTIPPSKSMGEVKALQHLAVSLDLRSETLDTDTHSVLTKSSPVSYFASLSYHEMHETSSVVGSSMSYLTPSMSAMSLTTIDRTDSLSNGKGVEGNMFYHYDSSERPVLCAGCGLKSVLYIKESMKFPFSEIQAATSEFSNENLLGEGGFGHVYKGQLKDGQVIAAKVHKEASSQGYTEFFSEVQVLSFARHRNIVMLLGYCCKESYNILVYEYICNKSLEWHLFDKDANLLEWHKRHAIALGIAKGLRFLHEECRAGPIIHRDLRPSNVLLTHDFVPMLGDFGLAKWKASNASIHTRILGQSGYLAPEYAEYGIVSVRTDVYAFGIVLFQLISGRKVLDECGGQCTHILQWAEPLVESLALHELIDERIAETYDTYGLYHLARAAYLCVRTNPEQRPSMGEVVRLIESENEHIRDLSRQFIPHFTK
ncbi:inactive protein kinase SELMODRAFT_444075-like isoform X1 [Oryza glaberrima]|uniref:inactive protein kinase SELMODRAFT_444075-like isoform X1 n=1 Tax=Oryza glaberrima TaxID=4538 RepID=UPI00224C0D5C|nr:inactive protein kinase SELMODRAFT_444075-like isoform X1 [Oryza glaberrima]